jgi:ABC-2 type transport system permease protein
MRELKHIGFIALKDLKLFATDRMALLFALLFPFLFVVLFNFLLSGVGSQDKRLELHMVTLEPPGGLSYQIIGSMETKDPSTLRPGEPEIVWDKDYDATRRAVADKKLAGFLAFPSDFTQGVMMGYGATLQIVVDAEQTYTRAALYGLAQSIASHVGSQQVADNAIIALLVEKALSTGQVWDIGKEISQVYAGQGSADTAQPVQYVTQTVGEVRAQNPSDYVIPGYLVMFVFFTAALSAETIVRERQNNTLERLLASSVRREALLGGMFAGTAAKGLVQVLVFWAVGLLAFRIDVGASPAAVIILSLLMVIMSSAFAIMLATLAKTQRGASAIAVLTSLVLAPLGGCWWPLFITPRWMQFIAKLTPHGWATTGFNKLMVFGADFSAAVPEMLALVGFAAAFAIVAVWRFRTDAV